jgi:phosphohistidine phosphatase
MGNKIMKLYLVQHGDAVTKDIDPERPLSERGIQDVGAIAGHLKATVPGVAQIIHSGKLRAQQTAEILAKTAFPQAVIAVSDSINPLDLPTVIAEEIDQWQEDTMIVGHLPFLAKLVTLLVADHEEPVVVAYSPGTVVCLDNKEKEWRIEWMLSPALVVK